MTSEVIKPGVAVAIAELEEAFPSSTVNWEADSHGGAFVTLVGVPLNPQVFAKYETWVGFHITFQYPAADVYPHHVRPDLARRDGRALDGDGRHPNRNFKGRTSLMLSRRSKHRDLRRDTATKKLRRVLAWLEESP